MESRVLTLEDLYEKRRQANWASVCYHMPVIREFASECSDCVEFGVRKANTTVSILCGTKGTLRSWDLESLPQFQLEVREAAGSRWHFNLGRSEEAQFDSCDLLLHDTFHNYAQVKRELEAHAHKVKKYLMFHDTWTYARRDGRDSVKGGLQDTGPGMLPAILELMQQDPSWAIKWHDWRGDGLLVLERLS